MPATQVSRPAISPSRRRSRGRKQCCTKCKATLTVNEVSYGHDLCNACYDQRHYGQEDDTKYEEKLGLLRFVFCYERQWWWKLIALVCLTTRPAVLTYLMKKEGPWWQLGPRAEAYLVEGIIYCAAYACCLRFVDNFRFACGLPARYIQFNFLLLPDWDKGYIRIKQVWKWIVEAASCGCALHAAYSHAGATVGWHTAMFVAFYMPLWAMLALWVGTCAELAARVQSLTHRVKGLFDVEPHDSGAPSSNGGTPRLQRNISDEDFAELRNKEWDELRNVLRDLHKDAKKLSAWWALYALGGLVANAHYVKRRFQDQVGPEYDLSTTGGLMNSVRNAVGNDGRLLVGLTMPLFLSLLMLMACELLPNAAHAILVSRVKEGFLRYGHGGDDNGWSGLLECTNLCTTTFRFWLIGRYNVACAVKCMITFQVLAASRPLDMVEGFVGLS